MRGGIQGILPRGHCVFVILLILLTGFWRGLLNATRNCLKKGLYEKYLSWRINNKHCSNGVRRQQVDIVPIRKNRIVAKFYKSPSSDWWNSKKIEACVLELNQTEDAKFVNEHILVLIPNSPNAKGLFNSNEKIAADQVVVLNRFKVSTLKCRAIANELPNSDLVEVYTSFYSKIDAVYADLIDQRITIGVANQERAMRIQYARTRWTEILKTQTGV